MKETAFFLYRDSPLRRAALTRPPGAVERYSLYGLDEVAASGFDVSHNLEPGLEPGFAARSGGSALRRVTSLLGGYPGDFASVLACRGALNEADVVFSTVDTLGIPLTLLARRGVVRTPIVYAAIGLPERLEQLRPGRAARAYRDAYRRLHTIVAYGAGEVDALRDWLGEGGPDVRFVPFGVDTGYFRPDPETAADVDVVSIGADPRRDHELLLAVARSRPEWSFLVVAPRDRASVFDGAPANVRAEYDVPVEAVRDRLRSARVVALPVRDNTYSGATTVLLQAMATGKPVVVSRTAAIADGYHLEDGSNAVLVPPGEAEAFESALAALLADEPGREAIGARARETVEHHLTWSRYTNSIYELLSAASGTTVPA